MLETIQSLRDEGRSLDDLVSGLTDDQWMLATPAAGWTIAHQIGHLLWSDEAALATVIGDGSFSHYLQQAQENPLTMTDISAERYAALAPSELLSRWRDARDRLSDALAGADPVVRLEWFGPPMSPRSMATARLMETWAHGQDVADALGVRRPPTNRLRDIAHLGVRTRDFAYVINGIPAPTVEFRVELTGPTGDRWAWGPEDAVDRVTGTAEAFCLVVTQRREPDQVDLAATDGAAAQWISIAQVFAGPPKAQVRSAHGADGTAS